MGMYTYYTFDGIVKPEYRDTISKLYDYRESKPDTTFEQDVKDLKFEPLYEFITGERATLIFYGYQCDDCIEFDKDTGHWHLECDIKDYNEHIIENDWHSPYKKYNSMDLFLQALPKICEDHLEMTKHYEEDAIAEEYKMNDGKFVWMNEKDWRNAQRELYGYYS